MGLFSGVTNFFKGVGEQVGALGSIFKKGVQQITSRPISQTISSFPQAVADTSNVIRDNLTFGTTASPLLNKAIIGSKTVDPASTQFAVDPEQLRDVFGQTQARVQEQIQRVIRPSTGASTASAGPAPANEGPAGTGGFTFSPLVTGGFERIPLSGTSGTAGTFDIGGGTFDPSQGIFSPGQQGISGTSGGAFGFNPPGGLTTSETTSTQTREEERGERQGVRPSQTQTLLGQGVTPLAPNLGSFDTTPASNQGVIDASTLDRGAIVDEIGNLAQQFLANNPNAPKSVIETFQQLDVAVANERQRLSQQNQLPDEPLLDENIIANDQAELEAILNAPTEFYEQAQRDLGIPADIEALNAINTEIQALVSGKDSMVAEIARLDVDPSLPRGIADRMIGEIETAVRLRLEALQLRAGIINDQLGLKRDELRTRLGLVQDRAQQEFELFQDRQGEQQSLLAAQRQQQAELEVARLIQSGVTNPAQIVQATGGAISNAEASKLIKAQRDAQNGDAEIRGSLREGIVKITTDINGNTKVEQIVAPTSGGGGGTGTTGGFPSTSFTKTQLNKGAANAGLSIENFRRLDEDTKNFFINNAKEYQEKQKAALDALNSGENPNQILDEISQSNLPTFAKNQLAGFVSDNIDGRGLFAKIESFFR